MYFVLIEYVGGQASYLFFSGRKVQTLNNLIGYIVNPEGIFLQATTLNTVSLMVSRFCCFKIHNIIHNIN